MRQRPAPFPLLLYNPDVVIAATVRHLVTLAVVAYLCAAGWFFILAPWSGFWQSRVVAEAPLWLSSYLSNPALRGAITGFGVLHFPVALEWLAAATRRG